MFLTHLLLVTLLAGPCIPQNQEEFILITLKSIAAKQDSLLQKIDVVENKLSAQHEQLENLKLSVDRCSAKHQISTFHDFLATDECETNTHNCSIYATCRDSPIHFECSCMAGYSGDGFICEDFDECKDDSNVCRDEEVCINLPGNYTCICQDGYVKQGDICQEFVCDYLSLELKPFGCITFVDKRMTWGDAQAKCNADGGSLLYGFTKHQLITIAQFFQGIELWNAPWVGVKGGLFVKSPSDDDPGRSSSAPDTNLWAEGGPNGTLGDNTQCGGVYLDPSNPDLWDAPCYFTLYSLCAKLILYH